jgi:hypothetical protein
MPTPLLRSIKGQEFFCSLCDTKFKAKLPYLKQATVKELGGPDLEGVAERCGGDERCAPEGLEFPAGCAY